MYASGSRLNDAIPRMVNENLWPKAIATTTRPVMKPNEMNWMPAAIQNCPSSTTNASASLVSAVAASPLTSSSPRITMRNGCLSISPGSGATG